MDCKGFFYGTLMAPQVLYRIIGGPQNPSTTHWESSLRIRPAILHAHKRHRIKDKEYPAIIAADQKSYVQGMLVEGLTEADFWRLDIYEGSEYIRQKVRVRAMLRVVNDAQPMTASDTLIGEDEMEAYAYVWIDEAEKLELGEWDLAGFVREEMQWWVGREATGMREGFQGRASINGTAEHKANT